MLLERSKRVVKVPLVETDKVVINAEPAFLSQCYSSASALTLCLRQQSS